LAQALDEEVEETTGLLALRWLASGHGDAVDCHEDVVGFNVRPQGPSGGAGVEERGDGNDAPAAAFGEWIPRRRR
jgi:hypothetical protein